jgi:DNA-binding transcriptional LysR family regulator
MTSRNRQVESLAIQRLPPLTMVRAFEAVGRTGSMRRAAEDIHVSHTVVSRHVRNLEAWIGVKLLDAGPRGVALTPEGMRFFKSVSEGLNLIASAALELRPMPRRRSLRLWCMPGLATRWLAPQLSAIDAMLPGVEIVLRAIDRLPDFRHHEADLMIAFGNEKELPQGAVLLAHPRMFPVASPEWLARKPAPASVAGLARSPLIHEENHVQWKAWLAAAGISLDEVLLGPRLWDANLGLDAAIAGQGVALASQLTAGAEIASGRLVELFDTDIKLGGYFLLISPDCVDDPLVRRFETWLRAAMGVSVNA